MEFLFTYLYIVYIVSLLLGNHPETLAADDSEAEVSHPALSDLNDSETDKPEPEESEIQALIRA